VTIDVSTMDVYDLPDEEYSDSSPDILAAFKSFDSMHIREVNAIQDFSHEHYRAVKLLQQGGSVSEVEARVAAIRERVQRSRPDSVKEHVARAVEIVSLIDGALDKIHPYRGIVYRGMQNLSEDSARIILESATVDTLRVTTSATRDPKVAIHFMAMKRSAGYKFFWALNQVSGAPIDRVSAHDEKETVIRGKYEVSSLGVVRGRGDTFVIFADEVN
jgi:hypothetical protein